MRIEEQASKAATGDSPAEQMAVPEGSRGIESHSSSEEYVMKNQSNKAVVRRFWRAFEENDQEALNELLASDLRARPLGGAEAQDLESHLRAIGMFNAAFTERSFVIHELVAEGDQVAARITMTATHSGDWQGSAASGKRLVAPGMTLERIEGGRIVERVFSFDSSKAMRDLGIEVPRAAN